MPIVLSSIHEVLQFVMEKVDESLKTLLEKIKPALIQAVSVESCMSFEVEGGQVDPAVRGQGAGRQSALGGFGRCFLRPSRLQHHFGQGSEDL